MVPFAVLFLVITIVILFLDAYYKYIAPPKDFPGNCWSCDEWSNNLFRIKYKAYGFDYCYFCVKCVKNPIIKKHLYDSARDN